MKADPQDQRRLLDLQAVDTALTQLAHRRRTLPERAERTNSSAVPAPTTCSVAAAAINSGVVATRIDLKARTAATSCLAAATSTCCLLT